MLRPTIYIPSGLVYLLSSKPETRKPETNRPSAGGRDPAGTLANGGEIGLAPSAA